MPSGFRGCQFRGIVRAMKRVLVVLVVLACSCKAKTNDLPGEAWSAADYASAGLATDKPWTHADHTRAAAVLAQQTAGHRDRLPRFQGAKSGAVFAKLIATLPPDDDQPIADRFIAHVERYEATNAISKLYVENALAVPTREWIELMGALLRESVVLATAAQPFLASFGPDDPQRDGRLRGLAKMQSGFGQMILGSLLTAGDLRVPEADRLALVEHVNAALPVLLPQAPAETQQQIRTQVTALVDKLPAGKLRDRVREAQAIVKQSLPASN
jgi:hypothetical protein